MKKKNLLLTLSLILLGFCSCNKSNFLDKKPDEKLILPKTLPELQSILDNNQVMNGAGTGINPSFGEAAADNFYVTGFIPTPQGEALKKLYVWDDNIYDIQFYDWSFPYKAIFYANIVLDELKNISPLASELEAYDNIKGSALFFRSEMFQQLAQIFCPPYDPSNAESNYGIVLKLKSDINESIQRATIEQTYRQIITDLRNAAMLLPNTTQYKTRPSKAAAFALLGRTYLVMRNYDSAKYYSNNCLKIYSELMDYNGDPDINYSGFKQYNREVIFHSILVSQSVSPLFNAGFMRVDSNLYNSYDLDDLRREIYFSDQGNGKSFRGSYDGSSFLFGGIATDEVFLMRAEANARLGNLNEALDDLNHLMRMRWRNTVPYPEINASTPTEALNKILNERRKELIFRGLRWPDLRRLNKEGAQIYIKRLVNGETFALLPNSPKYTFLIPPEVISFNPNIPQNIR